MGVDGATLMDVDGNASTPVAGTGMENLHTNTLPFVCMYVYVCMYACLRFIILRR